MKVDQGEFYVRFETALHLGNRNRKYLTPQISQPNNQGDYTIFDYQNKDVLVVITTK